MLSWGNETSFSSLFVHHSWHSYMHSHHHCYLIVSEYVTNIFWSRAPSKPASSLQPKKGDILKDGSEERKEVSGVLQPTPKELLDHQLEPMRYFHFVQRLQYVIYVTFIWMQASSCPLLCCILCQFLVFATHWFVSGLRRVCKKKQLMHQTLAKVGLDPVGRPRKMPNLSPQGIQVSGNF